MFFSNWESTGAPKQEIFTPYYPTNITSINIDETKSTYTVSEFQFLNVLCMHKCTTQRAGDRRSLASEDGDAQWNRKLAHFHLYLCLDNLSGLGSTS